MRTTKTVDEIIEEWILNIDVSSATIDSYRAKINIWFRFLHATNRNIRISQKSDVLAYKKYLLDNRKSTLTIDGYVNAVKQFYKYCHERNYHDNISQGIKSSSKYRGHRKESLSVTDSRKLLSSIELNTSIGRRDRLIISLMLFNALRGCEIVRINIGDIKCIDDVIVLKLQRKGRADKSEEIAISHELQQMFIDYIADREIDNDAPVFLTESNYHKGQRLERQSISRMIKKRLKLIGINRRAVTAHSLRHTCGSMMVENGVPLEVVMDMMGHTDSSTTRLYVQMAMHRKMIKSSPSLKIQDILLNENKENFTSMTK